MCKRRAGTGNGGRRRRMGTDGETNLLFCISSSSSCKARATASSENSMTVASVGDSGTVFSSPRSPPSSSSTFRFSSFLTVLSPLLSLLMLRVVRLTGELPKKSDAYLISLFFSFSFSLGVWFSSQRLFSWKV